MPDSFDGFCSLWPEADPGGRMRGVHPPEMYTNRSTGVDCGRSFNVSAGSGVISFQLLQEQDPE